MSVSRFCTLVVVGLVAFALVACRGPAATPAPEPTPTPTPPFGLPPLTLPEDEAPHDFQTEWWYFNMHLASEEGERFTLHDVVFQVRELETGRTLYVRQTGLADAATGAHVSGERLRIETDLLPSEPAGFHFEMGDWLMTGSASERYRLLASAGLYSYELSLASTSSPLLHGQDGLVDFDLAGVSYYYTRPRLDIEGTLTTPDGRELTVTGLGWMDKQWGNFQPVIVGWDWASVQLDDGTDIKLSRLFDRDRNELNVYATMRREGQPQEHVEADGFEFVPLDATWTSERSGITYHTEWAVRFPDHGLEFALVPLVVGSEFTSAVLGVTYWEAGVDVLTPDGRRIGQGFVELNWPRRTPAL